MLEKVLNNLGQKVEVLNDNYEVIGEALGQIRLFKSNAKTGENNRVSELGIINDDTYIFVGSGNKDIIEENILRYNNERFLITRSDFSKLKGVSIVWAALKKLKGGGVA